jgi:hypothetical protein
MDFERVHGRDVVHDHANRTAVSGRLRAPFSVAQRERESRKLAGAAFQPFGQAGASHVNGRGRRGIANGRGHRRLSFVMEPRVLRGTIEG